MLFFNRPHEDHRYFVSEPLDTAHAPTLFIDVVGQGQARIKRVLGAHIHTGLLLSKFHVLGYIDRKKMPHAFHEFLTNHSAYDWFVFSSPKRTYTIQRYKLSKFTERLVTLLTYDVPWQCDDCGLKITGFLVLSRRPKHGRDSIALLAYYNRHTTVEDSNVTLFNIDHIVPVSKGGARDAVYNHRLTCVPCNVRKGDKLEKV